MLLLPRAGRKSWSLGRGQETCTEGVGAARSRTPAWGGPVSRAVGSIDPQCHCCAPATEDRSAREPLGTDSSAQGISSPPQGRREVGRGHQEKSELVWKAGGRDDRKVLQWW